jgi:hypothetical protein
VHASIPDIRSLPENEIATGWLYQPSTSAPRPGDPEVATGAVSSNLNPNVEVPLTFPARSVHVPAIDRAAPSAPS